MANPPIEGRKVVYTPVSPELSPEPDAPATDPLAWRGLGVAALVLFGIGVVLGLVGLTANSYKTAPVAMLISTVLFVTGFCCSIVAYRGMARAGAEKGALVPAVILLPMFAGALFSVVGALLTFFFVVIGGHGRQLRRRTRVLLPPLETGAGWGRLELPVRAADDVRAPLAAWWRENARSEHASVAAFARLVLELIGLGAPARLIEAANRDAMDEIRHANLCFSIAWAFDGRCEVPGAFREARRAGGLPSWRPLALATLAVRSLVDGALHEGVAARLMARLAPRCEDPAVGDALRELAADEGRHAAHAWDVIEWCLAEGGAPVAHALCGASRSIGRRIESGTPAEARSGAWESHGVHGASLEAEELARTRSDLIRRVRAMTDELLAA